MYYNTVNKRILITANKRIHIISAYFLAAASDKCMRLLTSLYGSSQEYNSVFSYWVEIRAVRWIPDHDNQKWLVFC